MYIYDILIMSRGGSKEKSLLSKEGRGMADSEAKKNWVAANTTRVVMNLNHHTDKDLLEKLNSVPSKQGYIKALIRKDLGATNTKA